MGYTRQDVIDTLNDPLVRRIDFHVGKTHVDAEGYLTILDMVETGVIEVVEGDRNYAEYIPKLNRLRTQGGRSPAGVEQRATLLHESTHAIVDLRGYAATRLDDEVAGYLAHLTYALLSIPDLPDPPIGGLLNNLMRQGFALVRRYKLHLAEGAGARIAPQDIRDFGRMINALPLYRDIAPEEMTFVDGVVPDIRKHAIRLRVPQEPEEVSTRYSYSAKENYPMPGDEWLAAFLAGKDNGKRVTRAAIALELGRIFRGSDAQAARDLHGRLSARVADDPVSQAFWENIDAKTRKALLPLLLAPR